MSVSLTPAAAIDASRQHAVLLVDDDAGCLGALRLAMQQQGYQTFVAISGDRKSVV